MAIVPEARTDTVVEAMVRHLAGREATVIGSVTDDHPGWWSGRLPAPCWALAEDAQDVAVIRRTTPLGQPVRAGGQVAMAGIRLLVPVPHTLPLFGSVQ